MGGKRHMTKLAVVLRYFTKAPKNWLKKQGSPLTGLKVIQQMSATTPEFLKTVHLLHMFLCCTVKQFIPVIFVCIKQSLYRSGQAQRFPAVLGCQVSRQSANKRGTFVTPTNRPPFPPRKYSQYSFLLKAESTTGSWCSQKESKPRPSSLWRSVSTKRANTWPPSVACYSILNVLATSPSHYGQVTILTDSQSVCVIHTSEPQDDIRRHTDTTIYTSGGTAFLSVIDGDGIQQHSLYEGVLISP
jgi:hypothetical protein